MPSVQDQITDQTEVLVGEYQGLAATLDSWRTGAPYPFVALVRLLELDRRAEAAATQINSTSQRNSFLSQIGSVRESLQQFGGSLLDSYARTRMGEIYVEGRDGVSFPRAIFGARFLEIFQIQELMSSAMVVQTEEERDRLLSLWADRASLIDEVWQPKVETS